MRPINDYNNMHESSYPEGRTLDGSTPADYSSTSGNFSLTPYDYSSGTEIPNSQTVAMMANNDYLNRQDGLEPDGGSTNLAFVETDNRRQTYLQPSMVNRMNQALPHSAVLGHDVDSRSGNLGVDAQPPRCPSGSGDTGNDENNSGTLKIPPPRPPRCSGASDQSVNLESLV